MRKALKYGLMLCGLIGLIPIAAGAQAIRVPKGSFAVRPETAVGSPFTVSVTSPPLLTLKSGVASQYPNIMTVTTIWGGGTGGFGNGYNCVSFSDGLSTTCSINLYAWFESSTAALSNGVGGNIPSSEILGQLSQPTGSNCAGLSDVPTTYTPFTGSGALGIGGATLELYSQSMSLNTSGGTCTASLSLEINLASQPQLPAGTYTGTLTLQAESF